MAMEPKSLTFDSTVTNSTKLLVPFTEVDVNLLDKDKYNFWNAYSGDINRPWLEDKIFLVYKAAGTLNLIRKRLYDNPNYHSSYWIMIDGESYDVLVFNPNPLYTRQVGWIKDDKAALINADAKQVITAYWGSRLVGLVSILSNPLVDRQRRCKVSNDIIKEEDTVLDDTLPSIWDTCGQR